MIIPKPTTSTVLRYIDLERQLWRDIATFTDIRLLKDKIISNVRAAGDKITSNLAMQKSEDIIYCIKQANEYFLSSKSCSIHIKPTLIYYGIVNLSIALLILRKREKSLNSIRGAHALRDKYPSPLLTVSRGGIKKEDILDISVELQESGTFSEVSKLSLKENFVLGIKRNSGIDTSRDFTQNVTFKTLNPGSEEIKLRELLQNIPEIRKEIQITLKTPSLVFLGDPVLKDNTVTCRILSDDTEKDAVLSNFKFAQHASFAESNNFFFFSLPHSVFKDCTPLIKRDVIGNQYFVADLSNRLTAGDFTLYYLTFFILGSLSRYKPSLWREILEDPKNGLGTIPEILCESAYIKFPLHFLSELNDKFYKF